MALKTYTAQTEIPEALRGEYIEKDGKWIPNVENAEELYASGLKASQRQLLDEKKKAESRLAAYDGIDPEEHRRLKEAAEEAKRAAEDAESARQRAAGDWNAREAGLKAAFERDMKALKDASQKELEKLRERSGRQGTFIETLLGENKLREVFQPLLVAPEDFEVMRPHLLEHIKVVEDGDSYRTDVVHVSGAERGQPRIRNGQGEPFTVEDLVKEMAGQERYGRFFKGTGASGSGARGSGVAGTGGKKTIKAGDDAAFSANLDGVIKGDVVVVP